MKYVQVFNIKLKYSTIIGSIRIIIHILQIVKIRDNLEKDI
jgi:hypothetical protein